MVVENLSLEEKIGQMLLIGFRGTEVETEVWLSKSMQNGEIGGVILFDKDYLTKEKRNILEPTQLSRLIHQLKTNSKYPLFIAIDQEGGSVARLNSSNGFEDFPSANEIASKEDIGFAQGIYAKLARNLKKVGFNVNFAPVLDLCLNPENSVIVKKKRCFSSELDVVLKYGEIFIQSHIHEKILPVAKHYPGHGSSVGDTHLGWVDVTNTWQSIELKPYESLNGKGLLPAIMVGHLFNRNIDPLYPATLSHIWIEEILRKQIRFDGLVFTDDLQMKAISEGFSFEEVVELGINAGVDIFVFANQIEYDCELPKKFIDLVKELLSARKLSIERIDRSVERILGFKTRFMLN